MHGMKGPRAEIDRALKQTKDNIAKQPEPEPNNSISDIAKQNEPDRISSRRNEHVICVITLEAEGQ